MVELCKAEIDPQVDILFEGLTSRVDADQAYKIVIKY